MTQFSNISLALIRSPPERHPLLDQPEPWLNRRIHTLEFPTHPVLFSPQPIRSALRDLRSRLGEIA